jgi:iron complex transport system substrate-binding protein
MLTRKRDIGIFSRGGAGMMHLLRTLAALVFVAALPALGFAGPFKDAADRTVDVPSKVARIIPAGPPAQVLLQALAPDKLAGLVEAFPAEGKAFVPDATRNLAVIPRLSRSPSEADIATLRGLAADLVVDYGSVGQNYVASINKAQADLGVPAILLDGRLAGTPANLRQLGLLIGVADRAEQLAALAQKALDKLAPLAALSSADRVSVYLARGSDGLNAARPGGSVGEAIEFAGGRNVVASGSGAFFKMEVADVVALTPDVVIFENAAALKSPLRAALPAKTRVYLDSPTPYGALESPPSLNRLIGALVLGSLLHPDRLPPDPAFVTKLHEAFFGPIPAGQKFAPLVAN